MKGFIRDLFHGREGARFLIVFVCLLVWWIIAIAQSIQPI
jgi:hypothetical protein